MGNCLRNNKISSAQEHEEEAEAVEEMKMKLSAKAKSEPARRHKESIKKMVRLKQKEYGRSGAVRIKVVMTQEELKRILSYENDSQRTTLEQLLSAMKLRGREEHDGDTNTWRPSLESIPEDRSLK